MGYQSVGSWIDNVCPPADDASHHRCPRQISWVKDKFVWLSWRNPCLNQLRRRWNQMKRMRVNQRRQWSRMAQMKLSMSTCPSPRYPRRLPMLKRCGSLLYLWWHYLYQYSSGVDVNTSRLFFLKMLTMMTWPNSLRSRSRFYWKIWKIATAKTRFMWAFFFHPLDICYKVQFLNCTLLHVMLQTNIGDILIAVNPFKPLPIYNKSVSTHHESLIIIHHADLQLW